MKSSLPEADRHDSNDTHWDDYQPCETGYPVSFVTGQVMAFKNQIIII